MGILTQLERARFLSAECPNCGEEFRLPEARLFDATRRLPPYALDYLRTERGDLAVQRDDLRERMRQARESPRVRAEAVNVGTVVEQIAPSLPGFPVAMRDCRSIFKPIDYLVFNGLSSKGRVDSVIFVDVKSNTSRLTPLQSQIRSLVEGGKVRLLVTDCFAEPRE